MFRFFRIHVIASVLLPFKIPISIFSCWRREWLEAYTGSLQDLNWSFRVKWGYRHRWLNHHTSIKSHSIGCSSIIHIISQGMTLKGSPSSNNPPHFIQKLKIILRYFCRIWSIINSQRNNGRLCDRLVSHTKWRDVTSISLYTVDQFCSQMGHIAWECLLQGFDELLLRYRKFRKIVTPGKWTTSFTNYQHILLECMQRKQQ